MRPRPSISPSTKATVSSKFMRFHGWVTWAISHHNICIFFFFTFSWWQYLFRMHMKWMFSDMRTERHAPELYPYSLLFCLMLILHVVVVHHTDSSLGVKTLQLPVRFRGKSDISGKSRYAVISRYDDLWTHHSYHRMWWGFFLRHLALCDIYSFSK